MTQHTTNAANATHNAREGACQRLRERATAMRTAGLRERAAAALQGLTLGFGAGTEALCRAAQRQGLTLRGHLGGQTGELTGPHFTPLGGELRLHRGGELLAATPTRRPMARLAFPEGEGTAHLMACRMLEGTRTAGQALHRFTEAELTEALNGLEAMARQGL